MFISFFSHTYAHMHVYVLHPTENLNFLLHPTEIFHTRPNNHPTELFYFNYYPTELLYFNYYPTERRKTHHHPTERPPKNTEKDKPDGKHSTKIYGCLLQRAATFRRVCYRRKRAETLFRRVYYRRAAASFLRSV